MVAGRFVIVQVAPLDAVKTAGFTLGPPLDEARVAVLLLHGFTGSPWEVRPLGESLAARGVHVRCPRLPGHGTTPEAMLWAGHREWLRAAQAELESLRGARRVVIVGLSMGGLMGMILTARRTVRVDGLVLLAPVVHLKSRAERLFERIGSSALLDVMDRWKMKDGTDIEDDAVRAESPVLPRYPLGRAIDLIALQQLARAAESRIECPSLIIAAAHDHVVHTQSVLELGRRLPYSRTVLLQRGFHIIPRDTDRALAATEVATFIDDVT